MPPSFCYLRSIPIQPVIEAFSTALIENANTTMDTIIKDQLSIVQGEHCNWNVSTPTRTRTRARARARKDEHAFMEMDQDQDHLLDFSDELEEQAVAARKLSEANSPRFLKHTRTMTMTMPLQKEMANDVTCTSTCTNQIPLSNLIMPHAAQLQFEHEDDDNCDWTKLRVRERERVEGWDEETSAIQEYSNRLLQNIYLFQNLEPQMIESTPRTCRPKDVEFDDWLRKRKDRWRSERVYRKVRQLCSCTTSTRTRTTIP